MKISAKTLSAAKKAAEASGMSLDKWADGVLAEAAASSGRPGSLVPQLRAISAKIDQLAERQGLLSSETFVAKAGELLDRARQSASDFIGPIAWPSEADQDSAGEPTKRKAAKKSSRSRTTKAAKASGNRRRSPARKAKTRKS